jgi:hypothetical protein
MGEIISDGLKTNSKVFCPRDIDRTVARHCARRGKRRGAWHCTSDRARDQQRHVRLQSGRPRGVLWVSARWISSDLSASLTCCCRAIAASSAGVRGVRQGPLLRPVQGRDPGRPPALRHAHPHPDARRRRRTRPPGLSEARPRGGGAVCPLERANPCVHLLCRASRGGISSASRSGRRTI